MDDARDGKYKLAEALTRVVARDGFASVSVRSVATEAGVSGGTVQYHFPTRAAMIRYAMEWTSRRVEERLSNRPRWGEAQAWTREILLELLPLDAERLQEHSVWLAFLAHARTDPTLTDLKHRTNAKLRELYARIIRARRGDSVAGENSDAEGRDPELEARTVLLQSVLDGLSLQLADLQLDEALRIGPELLDRYLAWAVDLPTTS